MTSYLSKPDWHFAPCGRLDASVRERRIVGAPDFMRGLRALFVSDMHVLPRTRSEDFRALAARIEGAKPDLILLGGDYADEAAQAVRLFEAWTPLRPRLGCYGVLGNNDREAWPRPRALGRVMARAGCALLVNRSVQIPVGGGTLWVAGLDDAIWGRPKADGLYPAEPSPDAWRILLYHEPRKVSPMPDMMLSGHTHGGQFNLLGVTPYAVGFERLFGRRVRPLAVAGLHEVDGARLLVSKGIGASRLQWRVGVRPEIELLVFD